MKPNNARNTGTTRVVLTTLITAATLLLSACGQPGPLYLPKPPAKPAQSTPAAPAQPAATPAAPAPPAAPAAPVADSAKSSSAAKN